jgi:2-keto-4-pentenoate hydratase/2-oxohepta-3-ene-1,7-dioic acid hydratase in catechol pathway
MKLVSFLSARGPRAARVVGKEILDLQAADNSLPSNLREILALGSDGLRRAAAAQGKTQPLHEVKLLAPIVDPPKILCVGANYADHAAESGMAIPSEPIIFAKVGTTLRAPEEPILLPKVAHKVDYEAELVVVIGKQGKNIPRASAMQHVAGYACGHDVSARDWQKGKPGGQWTLGKGFDTFAPLGPFLVTADEVGDPNNLRVQMRLNGETMQDSTTSQFIFKIDFLIEYISACITLQPGDLLFTGTPPGVGFARNPPVFLKPGDVTEVEIEKLGVLRNPVASESL